jgi:6-pyruvoyltetrahydropterin/6-carboxytetrahydropterin synthase
MNYRNLDSEEQFSGRNTTTEFLARTVFERLAQALRTGRLGPTATAVTALRVTLHESHVAWASYEAELAPP